MTPLEGLAGRRVLIATDESFVALYLSLSLPQWGLEVVGPLRSADAIAGHVDTSRPDVACISINLPGLEPSMAQTMRDRGIACLFFGLPMTGAAWTAALDMRWPFSGFQMAYELSQLMTKPRAD
jgi:DNA-binding NarL/FixJ family response regulator